MLNNIYLKRENIESIKANLKSTKIIQLQEFLIPELAKLLFKELKSIKYSKVIMPMQYQLHVGKISPTLNKVLKQDLLKEFLEAVLNKKIKNVDWQILNLEHEDYTLMHDSNYDNCEELVLDLTLNWNIDFGGYLTYNINDEYHHTDIIFNSATILSDKNAPRFIKYVNHYAKDSNSNSNNNNRFLIIGKIKTK